MRKVSFTECWTRYPLVKGSIHLPPNDCKIAIWYKNMNKLSLCSSNLWEIAIWWKSVSNLSLYSLNLWKSDTIVFLSKLQKHTWMYFIFLVSLVFGCVFQWLNWWSNMSFISQFDPLKLKLPTKDEHIYFYNFYTFKDNRDAT